MIRVTLAYQFTIIGAFIGPVAVVGNVVAQPPDTGPCCDDDFEYCGSLGPVDICKVNHPSV